MGSYTAIIKRDGDWWIGWIEEVPGINAQERTREGLRASPRAGSVEALDLLFSRPEERARWE